jgi:hypothetical protein
MNRHAEIAIAAIKAGHDLSVERTAKRFRLVCTCGWATHTSWKRKTAFLAATEHSRQAGLTALAEVAATQEGPTGGGGGSQSDGVSVPSSVRPSL